MRATAAIASFFFLLGDSSCLSSTIISTNKNGGHSRTFYFDNDSSDSSPTTMAQPKISATLIPSKRLIQNLQSGLRSVFMPSGFPSSTPPGYLRYSVWSWIQDLSTQLRSVLATQRILQGVGVGREGATALAALLNFLVRDGCGMAATLVFTSVAASRFTANTKQWRLFADIMVDVGITLEIAATLVPQEWFLAMICVGNVCKAVCGVAAGACGGAINVHWAKGSDISDIQAKFGAQHTVSGSLGIVFAALFARSVSVMDEVHLWLLYSALTVLHIGANRKCMRLIAFDNYNTVRLNMAMRDFFSQWDQRSKSMQQIPDLRLSTPYQVSNAEPLLFKPFQRNAPYPIHFGVSFNEFIDHCGLDFATTRSLVTDQATKMPYWIRAGRRKNTPCVLVTLQKGITPYDQTKGYFHAGFLSRRLAEHKNCTSIEQIASVEGDVAEQVELAWNVFERASRAAGWDLTATVLQAQGYEIEVH
jgi:hypothetical protein